MGKTFEASSVLIGSVIGAGILGMPYVIMKSGYLLGLIYLVSMASIFIFANLCVGEVILRTKKTHQLTGYAERYLGKRGRNLMTASFAIGIFSALLAYLIGEGRSFSNLIFGSSNYEIYFAIAFWIIMSCLVFFELRSLKKAMPIGVILVIVLVICLVVFYSNKINPANLSYINLSNIFVPFGVVLFGFLGFSAMPEMQRVLGEDRRLMKRVIIIAYITVLLIYIAFTTVVLGFKGLNVPQLSTIALGAPFILLGILTMFTAYLSNSVAYMDILDRDYKNSKIKAWLIVIIVPIILFAIIKLTGRADFVDILGLGGVLSGGLNAFLIFKMVKEAKIHGDREPEYKMPFNEFIRWFLVAIFAAGATVEIIIVVKNVFMG